MHIVLASLGTDGDIFPYVGIGLRLQARGHRITLVAGEPYRSLALAHGFGFEPLITAAESDAWLGHPDFWHPIKTARHCARWGTRLIGRQYGLFERLVSGGDAVLVTQPAVFAATLAHEKFRVPLVHLLLQPGLLPSALAPPVMPAFSLPSWAPRPVAKLYWRALDGVGDLLVGKELNRHRASLGLAPLRRIFKNWWSPQRVLCLFPEWYGPPQADWPAQVRLLGFPMFDGGVIAKLPSELEEFCRAGPPPIAFTLGTGMSHGAARFRAALEACALLGARGIFLTKYREQLPAKLPSFAFHCAFAPFAQLFPKCASVLHHGGIGTIARALSVGLPQLITPLAFDQMDNAARVERLGAGRGLKSKWGNSARVAEILLELTGAQTRARCAAIAARFGAADVLHDAALEVEACR